MNRNLFKSKILYIAAMMIGLMACSDDEGIDTPVTLGESGIFVINEGGFGNSNASISFFQTPNDSMINNVFNLFNERPLGDQAQSMNIINDKAYIVVQNSSKVEVMDPSTGINTATIEERVISPRYITRIDDNTAYLSDWGEFGVNGYIKIIDTNSNTVTDSIAVGQGPNRMLLLENRLFVANRGGFGRDSAVVIIDTNTDEIVTKVKIGDNPNDLQQDADGNIWVTGQGHVAYGGAPDFAVDVASSTQGFIAKMDQEGTILLKIDVGTQGEEGPKSLEISPDKETLYYKLNGVIYSMDYKATTIGTSAFIDEQFYGFSVNPENGNIICGQAPDFSSPGKMVRYNASGDSLDAYTVGIAPNGFIFK